MLLSSGGTIRSRPIRICAQHVPSPNISSLITPYTLIFQALLFSRDTRTNQVFPTISHVTLHDGTKSLPSEFFTRPFIYIKFLVLQQSLASHEATIDDLRRALEAKEAQEAKLQFEVACASTMEADVDRLMVRVASLEKEIAKVSPKWSAALRAFG